MGRPESSYLLTPRSPGVVCLLVLYYRREEPIEEAPDVGAPVQELYLDVVEGCRLYASSGTQ
jgi:hypothetical protein